MTSALEGVEWSAARPDRTLPPGKDPVPIVQEAGWAPGPVWTGAENLASIGIRSPDRPARSQSLHRLVYPAHERKGSQVFNNNYQGSRLGGRPKNRWQNRVQTDFSKKVKQFRYRPGVAQRVPGS
jgi:hypothetical protein